VYYEVKRVTETNKIVGRIIKVSKGGWGFISSRDIEFTRIFFHWSALKQDTLNFKELEVGMWVEFIPTQVEGRGYRAIQVKVIPKVKHEMSTLLESGLATDGSGDNQDPVL
jgi:cold shock CspA family protein